MRYLILAGLLVACAAAPIHAEEPGLPDKCKKPIAQLSLEQIADCQNLQTALRTQRENFFRMQYEERHQQYLKEHGCGTVVVRRRDREPEIVETGTGCR